MTARRQKTVTVFADASFDERRRRAGWAVYIVSGRRRLHRRGVVRGPVRDSCQAELAALANGVCCAIVQLRLGKGDTVTAVSDNQHALGVLSGRQRVREDRLDDQVIQDYVTRCLDHHQVELRVAHVAGHRGNSDLPAAANTLCDQAARTALAWHIVEELQQSQHLPGTPSQTPGIAA